MLIVGEAELPERRVTLGVEGSRGGLASAMPAASAWHRWRSSHAVLPVQIIDPEIHRLIEEGPKRPAPVSRLGCVPRGTHRSCRQWQRYQQALRQRNAALKAGQGPDMVMAWDEELVRYGEQMTAARRRYVAQLAPLAAGLAQQLLGLDLVLSYRPGWSSESELRTSLHASLSGTGTSARPRWARIVPTSPFG